MDERQNDDASIYSIMGDGYVPTSANETQPSITTRVSKRADSKESSRRALVIVGYVLIIVVAIACALGLWHGISVIAKAFSAGRPVGSTWVIFELLFSIGGVIGLFNFGLQKLIGRRRADRVMGALGRVVRIVSRVSKRM